MEDSMGRPYTECFETRSTRSNSFCTRTRKAYLSLYIAVESVLMLLRFYVKFVDMFLRLTFLRCGDLITVIGLRHRRCDARFPEVVQPEVELLTPIFCDHFHGVVANRH